MSDEFKSFYKTVGGNEGDKCNYPTRLDTYGKGCLHDKCGVLFSIFLDVNNVNKI